MTDNPFLTPGASVGPLRTTDAASPLWTYIPAVLAMGIGVLYSMTCVLAPVGLPVALIGLSLWRAADASAVWQAGGSPDQAALSAAQYVRALRIYGIFTAVALLIELVVFVLIAIGMVIAGATGALN